MNKDLEFSNVRVSFGRNEVLRGLSGRAQSGRIFGLLGLNGAGKSTFFHAVMRLVPYDGSITLGGQPVDRALVGASINGPALYPQLSARGNLSVHALLTGTDPSRIDQVLDQVGLDAGRKRAGAFSTGMKMRLALAIALLTDPPLLLLDEPQNGLDPAGIRDLRLLIRHVAEQGTTVIISSHQLGEVEHMVDDIGIIAGGTMPYCGTLEGVARADESLEEAFFRITRGQHS
ncbi:MAG: ATP-binding cassette domain-containing protein [Actinomycetaceae bacterium]|nr:ATP-binding cassette domain-containing protein [Actinomycetaceae bacterium]